MGSIYNRRIHSHVAPGLDALAQEELLVEDLKVAVSGVERPLDANIRHSRMAEFAPPMPDGRRQSRLPVDLIDPFGFNTGFEGSPYDTALQYSVNERVRSSFLSPSPLAPSPIPSSSRNSSSFTSSGSTLCNGSTTAPSSPATSPVPWTTEAPWGSKQRSSSFGEPQSHRASVRASFMMGAAGPKKQGNASARPALLTVGSSQGRSKLSGEIHADNMSLADTTTTTLPPNIDYTHSKLYQRTLKAQKALEKDRAKAAAKGKISKADLQVQTRDQTSRADRRKSNAGSFVSDVGGFRSRSSLGWFRSRSEATLPLPPPPASFAALPIPTSRSVTQLPLPSPTYSLPLSPSPGLASKYASQQQPVPHPSPGHRNLRTPSWQDPNSATPSRMSSPAPLADKRRSREASINSTASRGNRASATTPIPTAGQMLAASVPLPETPTSETPQALSLPPSASDRELPRAASSNSIDRKAESPAPVPTEPSSPVKPIPKSASRNSLKAGHARTPSSNSRQSDLDMEAIVTPPPRRRTPSPLAARDELTNLPPRVSSIYADTGVEPILMEPQQLAVDPPAASLTTASTESLSAAPLTPLDDPIKSYAQVQTPTQQPVDVPLPVPNKAPALLGPSMIEAIKRPRRSSFRFFGGGKKDENERLANPTMKVSTNSNRSTQSAPVLLSKTPSKLIRQTFFGRSQRVVPTLPPSAPSSPEPSSRTAPFSSGSKSMPASPIRSSEREPMPALAFNQQQRDWPSAPLSQASTSASTSTRLSKKKSTTGLGTVTATRSPSGFFASFGRQRSKSSAAAMSGTGTGTGLMPITASNSTRPPLPAGPLPPLPSPLPPGLTNGSVGQGPPTQPAKAKVNGKIREFP